MSKDTIYRQDAIEAVEELNAISFYELNEHSKEAFTEIRRALKALPSADRPQGKWKVKSSHECFCNNCGFSFDLMKCEFLENMKHCPNCGVPKGADDEVL